MKAIWKGYLKCSLVTIPIKMYKAIARKALQFNLLHKDCGARIRQEMVCPACGKTLGQEDVVRGYQYGKDLHVVVTEAEFQQARKESTDTIEILKFIDAAQIHPLYYSDSHYLVPDGRAGLEAFALIHRAMAESDKTALAKVVMRNREHLFCLQPYNGALVAFTLHFPQEIQAVDQIEGADEVGKFPISEENLGLARTIIQHLSGEFQPEQYRDEYTQTLMEVIRAKAAGQEFKVEPRVEREKVVSLMDALKRSVEETAPGAAVGKKPMARAGERAKSALPRRQKA
ncbi:MAG: Ku protein [Deltaproteobacteria bacterium]|nr:Ku protein [Deltaproteobacteria bacterium]